MVNVTDMSYFSMMDRDLKVGMEEGGLLILELDLGSDGLWKGRLIT